MKNRHAVRSVETDVLRIAYVEHRPTMSLPVILSHGFPYDVHSKVAIFVDRCQRLSTSN